VTDSTGLLTLQDIIQELKKPGRDPRPEFVTASFKEGVETIKDLTLSMILQGTVTNVTDFGAFVDIGVHQDGLVHISSLSDQFVKDPREVVKTGDIVKVKVMSVDIARKRIGLSMRLSDEPEAETQPKMNKVGKTQSNKKGFANKAKEPEGQSAFAAAFAKAQNKNR
jgi:uncharacterized protein